ncbi:MAG: outer membrane lipoprotein-sorting protein [Pseudomonadota bacterium]
MRIVNISGFVISNTALIILCAGLGLPLSYAAEDVDSIMAKNYVVGKVAGSVSEADFRLISSNGQERVRKTTGKSKLKIGSEDKMSLVTFLSPADVKGTMTLTIENSSIGKDDDMWIYLPALKKVRRLVASNKKDSFVGTDFSYADVIGYKINEWKYTLLREENIEGSACFVVEAVPKSPSVQEDSGYSKRIMWIRRDAYVTVKGEGYDTGGELLKSFRFSSYKLVDSKNSKWVPMYLEAENLQTRHRTVIEMKKFEVNKDIPESIFSARSLQSES